MMAPIKL